MISQVYGLMEHEYMKSDSQPVPLGISRRLLVFVI